jgi:hypothetical protein
MQFAAVAASARKVDTQMPSTRHNTSEEHEEKGDMTAREKFSPVLMRYQTAMLAGDW